MEEWSPEEERADKEGTGAKYGDGGRRDFG